MILITGGAGYIGSHMNKYLNSKGYDTVILDNLSEGYKEAVKWGHLEEGDLQDQNYVNALFKKYKFTGVIHFAASASVPESVTNPGKYYRNNVYSTLNMLDAMVEYDVKTLVYSSTSATYGIPKKMPITEDAPQMPINPYGASKLVTENMLKDYEEAHGIKFIAFRYFNAAGADADAEIGEMHQPEHHLIPLVLDAVLGVRDSISVFGVDYPTPDGTCVRDYVHVSDLAQAHLLAMEYLLNGGESDYFNLGLGYGFSVKEIIEAVKRVTKKDFKVVEADRRAGDPPELCSGGDKARKVLGWNPEFTEIDSIIETAWNWHKKYRANEC